MEFLSDSVVLESLLPFVSKSHGMILFIFYLLNATYDLPVKLQRHNADVDAVCVVTD